MYCYYYNLCGGAIAQTGNICNNYCDRNLSTPIAGLQIDSIDVSYCNPSGSGCTAVDSFDVQYIENSCPASQPADKCSNDPALTPLVIRVYYPSNHNYTACKLSPIVLFHAGGYLECGSYLNPGVRAMARKLAQRGFVVFDVNYRVGTVVDVTGRIVPGGVPSYIGYTTAQQWLSIYKALADARGAIRSIIKMEKNGINNTVYQIDTTNIFLGGLSAGSVLAMGAAFYASQGKINQVFTGVSAAIGTIDPAGVYYADPPANSNDDYFSKIKGVLNCWGSLFTPVSAGYYNNPYSFFSGQGYNIPPVVSFHGKRDSTFNYVRQGVYFATTDLVYGYGNLFKTESRCLINPPFSVNTSNDNIPDYICIGSQTIYQMLKDNNIFTECYLDCEMEHGLDEDCTPSPAQCYFSDFGTGATTADATYDYIAGRAATFFQAILQGLSDDLVSNNNISKFTECENLRIKCDPDDAGGCDNEDDPCQ